MAILRILEGIRTPMLDQIMYIVTQLGDEIMFIFFAFLMLWCVDKKRGYFLLSIGFLGMEINTALKLFFRIPRPWELDPEFTIVEKARAGATGYSFPSGHTQCSSGNFGSIAVTSKKVIVKIVCVLLILAVAFSRMYLGVHTPKDVLVSLVVTIILLFAGTPVFNYIKDHRWIYFFILAAMIALAYGAAIYYSKFDPAIFDGDNLTDGIKTAYVMLGLISGAAIGWLFDTLITHYEVKASLKGQILKMVIGLAIIMALRMILKPVLGIFVDNLYIADCIRYFVMSVFATAIWPMTFKKFK